MTKKEVYDISLDTRRGRPGGPARRLVPVCDASPNLRSPAGSFREGRRASLGTGGQCSLALWDTDGDGAGWTREGHSRGTGVA